MKVLIRQATIISSSSPFNGKIKDILIIDGKIASISDKIEEKADQFIEQEGLCVSIGWMDSFAQFGDPGFEFRETLESGARAAAAGGFTDVMVLPNTKPAIDSKSQVEYIIQKSKALAINLHPVGAITKNTEGKELAEMYDMEHSGAVAFSDGTHSVQNAGLLLKALQYVKTFDGTIIQVPDDKSIGANGLMNEGIISTQLGLPGKPAMAEELVVARDIKLARYADSRLHFTGVSSAKSLEYIKRAKEGGLKITCSVSPYHLYFCDEDLQQYDTNLKVNPPLRTSDDRAALQKALFEGTIDCIASHHVPQNGDAKTCEFEYAKDGMIGLESLFGVAGGLINEQWTIDKFVHSMTVAPRNIFGFEKPAIKEGETACLTLFSPSAEYIFDESMIQSKSTNSAFIGKKLKGKVIGIVNGNNIELN